MKTLLTIRTPLPEPNVLECCEGLKREIWKLNTEKKKREERQNKAHRTFIFICACLAPVPSPPFSLVSNMISGSGKCQCWKMSTSVQAWNSGLQESTFLVLTTRTLWTRHNTCTETNALVHVQTTKNETTSTHSHSTLEKRQQFS